MDTVALLNKADFSAGPEHLQWPIPFDELARFSPVVEDFLGLNQRFQTGVLASTNISEAVSLGHLPNASGTKLRRKRFYRTKLKLPNERVQRVMKSGRILVITGATVGYLNFHRTGQTIESVSAYSEGRLINVKAKKFILACGLENAPIMLRSMEAVGLDTEKHLPALGRYLHSHLLRLRGFLVSSRDLEYFRTWSLPGDLGKDAKRDLTEFSGLQVSDEERINQKLLNGVMFLAPVSNRSLLMNPIVLEKAKQLQGLNNKQSVFSVRHFIEQPPRWESKVTLGDTRGRSPFKRAVYHWSIGDEEEYTINKNLQLLANETELRGVGKVEPISCGEEAEPNIFFQNCHPMGGTVMGDTVNNSVVDQNCKVHGIDNLYIVGGSVIPKSGSCMVTGVILQLSFRLAEHIVR